MLKFTADVSWTRDGANFFNDRYPRVHDVRFEGGAVHRMTTSAKILPEPMSDSRAVTPEEHLIAAISSCHMLWFFPVSARRGFCVDSYRDIACGTMTRTEQSRVAITEVVLRPEVVFSGTRLPTREEIDEMHAQAEVLSFISNSVSTEIRVEAIYPPYVLSAQRGDGT